MHAGTVVADAKPSATADADATPKKKKHVDPLMGDDEDGDDDGYDPLTKGFTVVPSTPIAPTTTKATAVSHIPTRPAF